MQHPDPLLRQRQQKIMQLNDDFTKRALVHSETQEWSPSPMPGVDRRMLDRIGDEVARATSIVRYAEDSSFKSHVHSGGEEFFVLDGVFQDEHGDFPAGSYVRNPPQSSHTPRSKLGCIIFVKLWQFDNSDRTHVRIDTNKMSFVEDATRTGISVMPLFRDKHEDVRLEKWAPNSEVVIAEDGGNELLVLQGTFTENQETLTKGSWLRLPSSTTSTAHTGSGDVIVWRKSGHLSAPITVPVG